MFESLVKVYGMSHTDEELLRDYNNGLHDEVIAFMYEKNKSAFRQVSTRYIGVTNDEVESIILEQIWKCFETYDSEKANKIKLVTLICTYIKNALRTYTQKQNSNKRKVNNGNQSTPMSCFDTTEDRFDEMGEEDDYNKLELLDLIRSENLSDNQRAYCEAALEYKCDIQQSHLAREIGVSTAGVVGIRRALQNKLAYLLD